MNLVPSLLLRSVVVTALVATTLLMAIVGATPALAQGVDCERVPYNEVIIVVCTSGGVDTPTLRHRHLTRHLPRVRARRRHLARLPSQWLQLRRATVTRMRMPPGTPGLQMSTGHRGDDVADDTDDR